ncbi:MAG TPA: hypothetical protein DD808_14805 [Halieaceae bacterium]|jgi:hypothetical protein|uniref:hypothetical protein n=1 Tax=Haliea TaxID=475794 RepID=UPI000C3E0900|nr:hypothetical protein [Haliea sp.]HAN68152.1 hypothetical protein [Halieaceae bacterium]MAD64850.1 hypothetical protein [Haliea sp.]MAY94700.1 hypothetical protein [Haliea sp.]MBP71704.1 hypothetical protein [Haliea sp.]HBM84945.1 hypothetical protein [Halieaceae bacterium]|tara:strand:+ start:85242 stop:85439 length:198 start_codon:yes stop_codon:yes gene_type:complete
MQQQTLQTRLTQKERERREIQRQIDNFIQRGGRISVIERAGERAFPGMAFAWQQDQDDSLNLIYP